MSDDNPAYNQKILLGYGAIVSLFLFGLALTSILALQQERLAARYPGSVPVSSHSNYSQLPSFRWDDFYRATDNFTAVYNWYSLTFDLGAESRALGKCILLEGATARYIIKRHTSVLLCDTPNGQMIYVTRSTSFN